MVFNNWLTWNAADAGILCLSADRSPLYFFIVFFFSLKMELLQEYI